MQKKKIIIRQKSEPLTEEGFAELTRKLASASSIVKLICGVGNNAAWMVMAHAMGELKQSPRYRHQVKQAFKLASLEIHRYETNLVTATNNRMFHIADMSPETRKRYGEHLSDRAYYDFWKNIGVTAYVNTKPLITSLQHKFALSLKSHCVKDPELIGWILTAQASLNLAADMYQRAIKHCHIEYDLRMPLLEAIFGQFDINKVSERWRSATCLLTPDVGTYSLEELEARNIRLGFEQLRDEWMSPDTLYSVTGETVADYSEIFATKGYQKKVLREIADVRAETNRVLEKNEL